MGYKSQKKLISHLKFANKTDNFLKNSVTNSQFRFEMI